MSLWERLSSAGRGGAEAVATGAVAVGSGTMDAFEALRDRWHKGVANMDKWAAGNFVSRQGRPAAVVPLAACRRLLPACCLRAARRGTCCVQ